MYWDLINSDMNRKVVQGMYTQIQVMRIWMFFSNNLVNVMRLGLDLKVGNGPD